MGTDADLFMKDRQAVLAYQFLIGEPHPLLDIFVCRGDHKVPVQRDNAALDAVKKDVEAFLFVECLLLPADLSFIKSRLFNGDR